MTYRLRLAPVRGSRAGLFLRCHPADLNVAREAFRRFAEDARHEYWDATLARPTRRRTLDQNALHWALLTIMSMEQAGDDSGKEMFHEAQLRDFAPPKRNSRGEIIEVEETDLNGEIIGRRILRKRSSELSTVEMARLIEGDFYRLAEMGVSNVEDAQAIRDYWISWANWRRRAKTDPVVYESVEDYRRRQTWCEACVLHRSEHYAHIGGGGVALKGPTTAEDGLMLCAQCHRDQHDKGWAWICEQYPHVAGKVHASRRRSGLKPVEG